MADGCDPVSSYGSSMGGILGIDLAAQPRSTGCTVHEPSLEATRVPLVHLFGLRGRASTWSFPPSALYSEGRVS